jgi:RNA polymerase sigma-B factor
VPDEIAERANATVGEILEARLASAARRPISLDGSPSGSPDPLEEVRAVEERGYRQAEERATIASLLRVLDEREREILRLRFADELLQREIADRVGISQMQVSRLLRRTLARLQAVAEDQSHRAPAPYVDSGSR